MFLYTRVDITEAMMGKFFFVPNRKMYQGYSLDFKHPITLILMIFLRITDLEN